ncbi:hypothetical protein S40293_04804 [Stachybotrys chartarum IBT 40293]|nr:hypothetical protein S40293_04804 [Stachybotrys chartarum IBT 40293]
MPHPYYSHAMLGISCFPAAFGLGHILFPEAMMRAIDFPVPSDPDARALSRSLMAMLGAQDIGASYVLYLSWRTKDQRLMGLGLLTALGFALFDGTVSRALIGGGEWHHWSLAPVAAGVSAGLLGWI